MSNVNIINNKYTVDSLYQWDKNQVLEISGLSLPSAPEIHFTNSVTDGAIVRYAKMDNAGIISVSVPNSLTEKPYPIKAYICIYNGDEFRTLYDIDIPIKARSKPSYYTPDDTDEGTEFINKLVYNVEYLLKRVDDMYYRKIVTFTKEKRVFTVDVDFTIENTFVFKTLPENAEKIDIHGTNKYDDEIWTLEVDAEDVSLVDGYYVIEVPVDVTWKTVEVNSYVTVEIYTKNGTIQDLKNELNGFVSDFNEIYKSMLINFDNVKNNLLPSVSSTDNDKILRVVNGKWSLVVVANAEDGEF